MEKRKRWTETEDEYLLNLIKTTKIPIVWEKISQDMK